MTAPTPPARLYPLRFKPRLVPKMWGGRRLAERFAKPLPAKGAIGESWELFDFPPGAAASAGGADDAWTSAEVADGPLTGRTLHDLLLADPDGLLGRVDAVPTPHGPQFPLLIKFLDASEDLSVQVHPDVKYARQHDDAFLKNEAWHVIHHEPGARLLKGLRAGVTRDVFASAVADATVERHLVALPARVGETHYLPSGTVHALGAGMLVAEVQTPSDTTYRVFDFDRVDPSTGSRRKLHVEQALKCIDFSSAGEDEFPPTSGDGVVAGAPQFVIRHRTSTGEPLALPSDGGPGVVIVLAGEVEVAAAGADPVAAPAGTTLLLPAVLEEAVCRAPAGARWLEVTIPEG